ncbi:MAG: O-acetylserine/cysteine efflux transporter [Thermoplasmata archaeon]|nr:O-acetylserine/cysteine efflux transporter [Thermoplasmata archaeon]
MRRRRVGCPVPSEGRLPPRDLLLALLVATVWGLNFIPIRWALDAIPPFALAALRFLLAAVPMVFFVPRPRIRLGTLVGYGLAIGVAQFGLLFLAIRLGLAAGLASLLMQMQMFFTILLAALVTGDPVRRQQALGACVAALGVAVLAADLTANGAQASLVGLLLTGAASLAWAAGNVVAKAAGRRAPLDMFSLVVWSSLVAPLPLAALSFLLEGGLRPWDAALHAGWRAWASIAFMAYVGTLFGYSTWNRLLQRHPAAVVSPFTMVIPVVGLGAAALVLHETLDAWQLLGALVILLGVAAAYGGRKAPVEPVLPMET